MKMKFLKLTMMKNNLYIHSLFIQYITNKLNK